MEKQKEKSPLVLSVLALDEYFSELVHLSSRIAEMGLETDSEIEQIQRLLGHFYRCSQDVSDQVVALSTALNESRACAEAATKVVSARAEELEAIQSERQKKMEEFRVLTEKVQSLNASLRELRDPDGNPEKVSQKLSEIGMEIHPLIDSAQTIRIEARKSKMKLLEKNAESLGQSLVSISQKLTAFQNSQYAV